MKAIYKGYVNKIRLPNQEASNKRLCLTIYNEKRNYSSNSNSFDHVPALTSGTVRRLAFK